MMSSRSNGVTNVVVEPLDDVVGDAVALVLADRRSRAASSPWSGHCSSMLLEQLGGADAVAPRLLEEVEELALLGREELRQPAHARGQCM